MNRIKSGPVRCSNYLPYSARQLYEADAVRLVHVYIALVHDEKALLIVYLEEGKLIALMIGYCKMPAVREEAYILRIISAYGQRGHELKDTCVRISFEHGHRILTGIGHEYMGLVRCGQPYGAGRRQLALILMLSGADGLDALKAGRMAPVLERIHIDGILDLVYQIHEASVGTEAEEPR